MFQEKLGPFSFTGVARETTFGTPVAPSQALPFTDNAINTDPGLFYPETMTGTRDLQTFALYGQRKHNGAVGAPLFPSNGVLFITSAIGQDGLPGYGVTGTASGSSTTLNGATSAGATTVVVTSASGIVANTTIIQIDVNNTSTPTTAECRLVTNVSGTTLTLDAALVYAHATLATVQPVIAPFTHLVTPETYLPSLTVEKNLGGAASLGGESLQYAGARIGKFDLKSAATNTEASFTADITAQSVTILDTPSSVSFLDESPFAFSTFTLIYNGFTYKNPTSFNLTVDNGLKPTWTYDGSQDLQFNPAVALHANGTFDIVFDNLDDSIYGFWNKMYTKVEASLQFNMINAQGYGITFNMPYVDLKMANVDPKVSDLITQTVAFEARRSLSNASWTLDATIINGTHLAY